MYLNRRSTEYGRFHYPSNYANKNGELKIRLIKHNILQKKKIRSHVVVFQAMRNSLIHKSAMDFFSRISHAVVKVI